MAEYPSDIGTCVYHCARCDTYWERSDRWGLASAHGPQGTRGGSTCPGVAYPITDQVLQAAYRLGGWHAVIDILGDAYKQGDGVPNRSSNMVWRIEHPWP